MMMCREIGEGVLVEEALLEELISTELFEAGSPWLAFQDVEATDDSITGQFTIHAINGDFVYRLVGWTDIGSALKVARALRISVPDGFTNPPAAQATAVAP